jgi:hypothetical protein
MLRSIYSLLYIFSVVFIFSTTASNGQVSPNQRGCIMGSLDACKAACGEGDTNACAKAGLPASDKSVRFGYVVPDLAELDRFVAEDKPSWNVLRPIAGACVEKKQVDQCVKACKLGFFNSCVQAGHQLIRKDPPSSLYFHGGACIHGERRDAEFSCEQAEILSE